MGSIPERCLRSLAGRYPAWRIWRLYFAVPKPAAWCASRRVPVSAHWRRVHGLSTTLMAASVAEPAEALAAESAREARILDRARR